VPERRLDDLCNDGEFIPSRVRRSSDRPPALFVRPAATHLADATIARSEHPHSLRGDLARSWAARPTDLIGPREELTLQPENPGGQVRATLLGNPLDSSCVEIAEVVAVSVGGVKTRLDRARLFIRKRLVEPRDQ